MKDLLRTISFSFILLVFFGINLTYADQLVYQPVNPNFGGSPFNGSQLLNNALSQNKHKEDIKNSPSPFSNSFEAQLERSILSRLSSTLVANAFGDLDEPLENFTVNTGISEISVNVDDPAFTVVTIINLETGESSVITIPNF